MRLPLIGIVLVASASCIDRTSVDSRMDGAPLAAQQLRVVFDPEDTFVLQDHEETDAYMLTGGLSPLGLLAAWRRGAGADHGQGGKRRFEQAMRDSAGARSLNASFAATLAGRLRQMGIDAVAETASDALARQGSSSLPSASLYVRLLAGYRAVSALSPYRPVLLVSHEIGGADGQPAQRGCMEALAGAPAYEDEQAVLADRALAYQGLWSGIDHVADLVRQRVLEPRPRAGAGAPEGCEFAPASMAELADMALPE